MALQLLEASCKISNASSDLKLRGSQTDRWKRQGNYEDRTSRRGRKIRRNRTREVLVFCFPILKGIVLTLVPTWLPLISDRS